MQRAYVDRDKRLVVFWSAKAACTTVAQWFCFHVLGVANPPGGARDYLQDNGFFYRPADVANLYAEGVDYRSIAFVRDPWSRCVSGFVSKFVHCYGKPVVSYDRMEPFAKRLYCQIRAQTQDEARDNYLGITFEEFTNHILRAIKSGATLDHHWEPQFPPSLLRAGIRPQEICDISDMRRGMQAIEKEFGLAPSENTRANRTSYAEPNGRSLSATSSLVLARDGVAPHKADLLSPTIVDAVNRAYARDFEALGYQMISQCASQ